MSVSERKPGPFPEVEEKKLSKGKQIKGKDIKHKNISELKDIYKGLDIWCILAGSSMDYVDPSFFEDKIVIGLNQVYKKFPCNYVLMKDCLEGPRFPRSIEELDKLEIPLLFSKYYKGYPGKTNIANHSNAYYFEHNPRKRNINEELEDLKDNEIFVGKSSVTSLMHVAAYMGAKNIILCGHDCGSLDKKNYFKGYMEKDWKSADNWAPIKKGDWMRALEPQSQSMRKYLKTKYECNTYSLNPFLNLGLEGHEYK